MVSLLSGCIRCDPPPAAPCPIEGLVLGSVDLPGSSSDWFGEASSIDGAPMRIGVERIGTSFINSGLFDGVLHDIYRFENEDNAFNAYKDVEEEELATEKYLYEWSLPFELSSLKLSTETYIVRCNFSSVTSAEECRFLAQYGSYLVRFSIRLHDLQYADVVTLIQEIDSRMTECLSPK